MSPLPQVISYNEWETLFIPAKETHFLSEFSHQYRHIILKNLLNINTNSQTFVFRKVFSICTITTTSKVYLLMLNEIRKQYFWLWWKSGGLFLCSRRHIIYSKVQHSVISIKMYLRMRHRGNNIIYVYKEQQRPQDWALWDTFCNFWKFWLLIATRCLSMRQLSSKNVWFNHSNITIWHCVA